MNLCLSYLCMTVCLSVCLSDYLLWPSSSPSIQGCFPADYTLDEQTQGHLSCLDSNHSHFLLVDDGTHDRYGVEIGLRSRLEKLIAEQSLGNRGELMDLWLS